MPGRARWRLGFVLISLNAPAPWCALSEPTAGLRMDPLDEQALRWQAVTAAVRGVLVRPVGRGPFPGIVVSHGLGGSAASFGLAKAREFARWGMVAVAPDYTHARAEDGPGGPSADRTTFGASAENVRRARFCVELLRRHPDVDTHRLVAYGHSMGGFVTIALAAEEPLNAAVITASGIAPREGFPAPAPTVARRIRCPMLMLHGADDRVVRPEQSEALKRLLDEAGVRNQRIVWPSAGHDLDRTHAAELASTVRAWLQDHGLLPTSPRAAPAAPPAPTDAPLWR
ncbi:MAG: dienelactone hydrolase family protein [Kiritimatiellae bacterium]|nr:dienelactone hydrolase family protein [Kiritimatiellia bacterium]